MSHNFWILLTFMSIASICKALPNVHKYMSPHQLQSVFHIENAVDVPHYEIVQLRHHTNDATHYRKRRSINVALASLGVPKESHHVKKDLSKNPYYSELKAAAAINGGNTMINSIYASPNIKSHEAGIFSDLSQLAEHNVSFSAFGKQHNLTLRKTQGLFKGAPHELRMWTMNSETNATNGLDLQEVLDVHHNSDHIGHVFQDEDNMAAILMRRHEETGDLIMEGSIGHEMVIKPLPHDLSPNKDETHHVIYKREASQSDHFSDFAFMEPDDLASREKLEKLQQQRRQRRSANFDDLTVDEAAELIEDELEHEDVLSTADSHIRARRQAPYMIYPEILVIVDYDGYRLHGGDNLQVKRYFISFWNGVDLRYRLLKGPRIRISIAGIIISRGRDATPYLERNRVGRDAIDSAAALTDMGKYLFRERRLPVYDIAVAITKLDMCRRTSAYGECNRGTAGFAYVGGACVVNKRLEKVNSVAIIEDTGGFSGIIVAAHEVGHLLGAVHDGSPPPSYLGGPGAQRCRWEDGYIMSDLRHTERGFRWSPCTVQSFHHFLNGDTATCLHNQPHEDSALGRSLPGSLLSLDAQCRRDRGTYACFKDERVCAQLFCFDAQTGYCVAYRPAAEGSSCGNGLHCLDGRCTPLPTNNVGYGPQYRLLYKNANNENSEYSSEEDDTDEDDEDTDEIEGDEDGGNESESDDEAILDDNENVDEINDNSKSNEEEKEPNEDENALQNLQKNDNSVEETSLEITDEHSKKDDVEINNIIPTTTTTIRPIKIFKQQTTPTQIQTQLNTIEYLKYILQNKLQWQQLLSAITTTTTQKPIKQILQPQQIQKIQNRNSGAVIMKTSTSSSVRFSSSQNSRNGNTNNSMKKIQNLPTTPAQNSTTQQHQTTLQHMTLDFQKQFQYYLNVLQQHQQNNGIFSNTLNNSNSNSNKSSSSSSSNSHIENSSNKNSSRISRSSSSSLLKAPKFATTTTNTMKTHMKSPTNSPNSNYSATNNNNGQHHAADDDNDEDENDNEDNNNNNNDENVESNEAIDKQKRKFDVKFTTRLQQQQQQQQHKENPTPTARSIVFGGRTPTSTTTTTAAARSNNFLEAYFRKLQAINAPAPAPAPASISTTPTINAQSPTATLLAQASPPTAHKLLSTTTTSSTSSTSSSSSSTTSTVNNKKQQQREQREQQKKQFDKFAGHFLKRTPSTTTSSHFLKNNRNNNNNNSTTITTTTNTIKNHNHQYQNQNNNNKRHENEAISIETTQPPAYVTNYIGDPTNNLPAIVVSDVSDVSDEPIKRKVQKPLDSLNLPTTLTTLSQRQQQQHQAQNPAHQTQKQQKIKTQKLIRRQLLRTQIK